MYHRGGLERTAICTIAQEGIGFVKAAMSLAVVLSFPSLIRDVHALALVVRDVHGARLSWPSPSPLWGTGPVHLTRVCAARIHRRVRPGRFGRRVDPDYTAQDKPFEVS